MLLKCSCCLMEDISMLKVKKCLIFFSIAVLLLCGCSVYMPEITINDYIVKLSTGADGEYMLSGGDIGITDGQVRLLLESVRSGYESALTSSIWNMEVNNVPFGEYIDNLVLDMSLRLVLVNMLAKEKHIELSEQERSACEHKAEAYYLEYAGGIDYINMDELNNLFIMMQLSDKVYDELTRDVDTQVSMDEARIIKIQYIYEAASDDSAGQQEKLEKAAAEYEEGADFAALAVKYSDSAEYSAEIGRGELEKSFEEAAFNLDSGQISDIVNCNNGSYLIYCIDDNVAGRSESQAESIIQRRKSEMFDEYLGEFSKGVSLLLDERAWERLGSNNSSNQ